MQRESKLKRVYRLLTPWAKREIRRGSEYLSAVGLEFRGQSVPTVSLSAEGYSADEVVKIANRLGIAVVDHPQIAELLKELPPDTEIPPELFEAASVILREIDERQKSVKKSST